MEIVKFKKNKKGRCILLPEELRRGVMDNAHNPPTSGHFGIAKTLRKVREQFFWPRMFEDVRKYVSSCEACQRFKPLRMKPKGLLQITKHEKPFQTVYTDVVGSFPRTPRGFRYIAVFICGFTRACELVPLKDATATSVARAFVQNVYCKHGAPLQVISDSGPCYKAKIWGEICKILKVDVRFCTIYYPQANRAELLVQSLNKRLAIYTNTHSDWDENLALISFGLNNVANDATGLTPFQLLYGRTPREITDFNVGADEEPPYENISQYAEYLTDKLKSIHELVSERTNVMLNRYKEYYDKTRDTADFKEGDLVLLKTHYLSDAMDKFTAKLAPLYHGPFEIIQQYSDATYKLQCLRTNKVLVKSHASQLRKYYQRDSADNDSKDKDCEILESKNDVPSSNQTEVSTLYIEPTINNDNPPLEKPVYLHDNMLDTEPNGTNNENTVDLNYCTAAWCNAPTTNKDSFSCMKCSLRCHFTCAGVHTTTGSLHKCVVCRE